MLDNAPRRPVKTRITHGQQQRWLQAVADQVEGGAADASIHAYLRGQDCPPRLREELIRRARSRVRGEHRILGLRMLAAGGGMVMHSGGLLKIAGLLIIAGVPLLAFGAWKVLSGSTVTAPSER